MPGNVHQLNSSAMSLNCALTTLHTVVVGNCFGRRCKNSVFISFNTFYDQPFFSHSNGLMLCGVLGCSAVLKIPIRKNAQGRCQPLNYLFGAASTTGLTIANTSLQRHKNWSSHCSWVLHIPRCFSQLFIPRFAKHTLAGFLPLIQSDPDKQLFPWDRHRNMFYSVFINNYASFFPSWSQKAIIFGCLAMLPRMMLRGSTQPMQKPVNDINWAAETTRAFVHMKWKWPHSHSGRNCGIRKHRFDKIN